MKIRMKAVKLTEPQEGEEYQIVRTDLKGIVTKEEIIAKHVEQLKEFLGDSFADYDHMIDNGENYSTVITYLILD